MMDCFSDLRVATKGSISFVNGNQYEYQFPALRIRVEAINPDVARIFFVDQQGNQVPVPPNTFHRDVMTQTQHNDFNGSFITWMGRHEIVSENIVLVQFNNQRQMDVVSDCEHWLVRNAAGRILKIDGVVQTLPPATGTGS